MKIAKTILLVLMFLFFSFEAFAQTIPNTDWPQLQRDAQRTGYSPVAINPPYQYVWKWADAPLASRTQPVVASGILYIGSLNGKLYALDANTGAEKWTYQTGGPIRHSAGVDNSKVFFSSHDGHVYALDALTGALIWKYKTGAGLSTAPLLANNTVYIGSRDKVFYALEQNTTNSNGTLKWSYKTNGPIENSAALSEDGNTIFFGSDDMYAYALNASTGALIWRTKASGGQSFRDRWPVVVGNKVIFRTQMAYDRSLAMCDAKALISQYVNEISPGVFQYKPGMSWADERQGMINHLTNRPYARDFFVYNVSDGSETFIFPILHSYGMGDTSDMPVFNKDTGKIYLRYIYSQGFASGGAGCANGYHTSIGILDLVNNDIQHLTPANPFNCQFRMVADEESAGSMGGNMLYVNSWTRIGAMNMSNNQLIGPIAHSSAECSDGQLPFYDASFPERKQFIEGRTVTPVAIANGILYWSVSSGDYDTGIAAIKGQ